MRTLPVNIIDARLTSILEQVSDPECRYSVLDLGVVRSASIDENNMVHLVITPTYAGCPAMDVIRFKPTLHSNRRGIVTSPLKRYFPSLDHRLVDRKGRENYWLMALPRR